MRVSKPSVRCRPRPSREWRSAQLATEARLLRLSTLRKTKCVQKVESELPWGEDDVGVAPRFPTERLGRFALDLSCSCRQGTEATLAEFGLSIPSSTPCLRRPPP